MSTTNGFGTKAIHVGQAPDPQTGAVCVPINLSSTFAQESPGVHKGFEYSRTSNPTRYALETCFAALESAEYGFAFASGSSATATLVHLLKDGDHVISVDDVYGGTNRYFQQVASKSSSMKFSFVDLSKEGSLEKAITPKTKMVWMETPTNPTLKIIDIQKTVQVAKRHDILVVVDNTFATPYFQSPLELGADIVVHSATKYINGHSDVVLGLAATNNKQVAEKIAFLQNSIGAVPSPFDCYMVLRGLKTLHLRMREHEKNAMAVAKFLEEHPKIKTVTYPGLPSHPQHELAKRQMTGFGGMVTFTMKGQERHARVFLESMKLITLAESLGAVESLAEFPVVMTHAAVPPEEREVLGIDETLVRLSIGIEDLEDIIRDLTYALDQVPENGASKL